MHVDTPARYRHAEVGGCVDATIEARADGTTVLRSTEALGWFPDRLTDCLEQWAAEAPSRIGWRFFTCPASWAMTPSSGFGVWNNAA